MAIDASSPYLTVPPAARWRESMSEKRLGAINPHLESPLQIQTSNRVASAGSCFAQRISEALQMSGCNYMVVEEGPPFLSDQDKRALGYGLYSARYGNVYTALQLAQLFRRAFGLFETHEPLWRNSSGGYADPFRPAIQPSGFATESECLWDRKSHLAAVRKMFQEMDIFIFTLGLTEAWCSSVDGAVFPVCPGSGLGGVYDSDRHLFHNFSVAEVVEHLTMFLQDLKEVNPSANMILTVSPVPLMATFEPRHVLQSTVYSKSVLRVACEELIRRHPQAHYFASYEIVTATGDSKSYFLADRRTVSDSAVAHVIHCFRQQFMTSFALPTLPPLETVADHKIEMAQRTDTHCSGAPMCDEDLIMAALAEQLEKRT